MKTEFGDSLNLVETKVQNGELRDRLKTVFRHDGETILRKIQFDKVAQFEERQVADVLQGAWESKRKIAKALGESKRAFG